MSTTEGQQKEPNEEYFQMREQHQMNMAQANDSVNHRLYAILMMVTGLVAIVALIISLVVFSNQSGSACVAGGMSESGPTAVDEKIWNLAIGHYGNNQAYLDEITGQVKGFQVDIAYEVCKIANKNCRVIYDLYNRCWDSQAGEVPRGGVGLMDKWYDGCVGWYHSLATKRTFKFTNAFTTIGPLNTYLYVKSNNPRGVNPKDLTGKIIGFIDGYITDEFCLKRQDGVAGNNLSPSQIRHYLQPEDLFNAITNGEVDAGFASLPEAASLSTIMALQNSPFNCFLPNGGASIMTRLDSDLSDWWNPALDSLLQSATYKQICQDISETHGGVPGADPSDFCIGM